MNTFNPMVERKRAEMERAVCELKQFICPGPDEDAQTLAALEAAQNLSMATGISPIHAIQQVTGLLMAGAKPSEIQEELG